jgi:hypothetical protein
MDPVLPVPPPLRQLVLPLEVANPSPRPLLRGPRLLPHRVWRGLPAGLQLQVRHSVLRVCQELAHDRVGWS